MKTSLILVFLMWVLGSFAVYKLHLTPWLIVGYAAITIAVFAVLARKSYLKEQAAKAARLQAENEAAGYSQADNAGGRV